MNIDDETTSDIGLEIIRLEVSAALLARIDGMLL